MTQFFLSVHREKKLSHFDLMTSLSYSRIFCLESEKIDGTEYLRGSTDFAIFSILLNLEAWNLVCVYKTENK